MKFQFSTAFFWLLLNASASSFATPSNYRSKSPKTSTSSSSRLPFLHRGDSSSTSALLASVESLSKSTLSTANLDLLSERGKNAILSLVENDVNGSQSHVYGDWPEAGVQDDEKIHLSEQVCEEYSLDKLIVHHFWIC
jgi:hypothetical protein